MKLYIYTQVEENYGAHDWNGVGEAPSYWKPKGGDVYLAATVSASDAAQLGALGLSKLAKVAAEAIERSDEYFKEYVVDWALLSDEDAACEDWETVKEIPNV